MQLGGPEARLRARQETCAANFRDRFGKAPEALYFAPGRVNLVGEHTDYNGGLVLPMAIDAGTCFALRTSSDPRIRIVSQDLNEQFRIDVANINAAVRTGHWSDYFVGTLRRFARSYRLCSGLDVLLTSSLPVGGGLSSSASILVGFAFALNDLWDQGIAAVELASIAQSVENDFVGVASGALDPVAVTMGKEGHVLMLNCSTNATEFVPFPVESYQVIAIDSGVTRNLRDSSYNQRRRECELALAELRNILPVQKLGDVSTADLDTVRSRLPPLAFRRVRHVVTENGRVRDAVRSLQGSEIERFADLLTDSHRSLAEDFQVSCPELDTLVTEALRQDGVLGAKLTGAGFGGCIVAIAARDVQREEILQIVSRYRQRTRLEAQATICRPSSGARRLLPAASQ